MLIDLATKCLHHNAREADTKYGKTFDATFCPVGKGIEGIVRTGKGFPCLAKIFNENDCVDRQKVSIKLVAI
jgi:hypothetical protein